jgi:acetylornithine deacetylase/succinyl-diaminopimelate desuccinylase-like protein
MAASPPFAAIPVAAIASERAVRECLQWFTREKQWINEVHLQLARVPAPTFLEAERGEWMAAKLRSLGWHTQIDRAGNVIALPEERRQGPYVAITAHLDTVLAPRRKEEIMVDAGGRFHGPGVSDNGAGLAALLAVARAWKSSSGIEPGPATPMLIATVGEEGEGNLTGMRWLCKQSPLAGEICAFLVLDGASTEHITTRALGSRRFEVTMSGPGGHSWSDHGAGNPVHALSRAVALFSDIRLNGGPRSSFNVGTFEGGTSINAIPPLARA